MLRGSTWLFSIDRTRRGHAPAVVDEHALVDGHLGGWLDQRGAGWLHRDRRRQGPARRRRLIARGALVSPADLADPTVNLRVAGR
jgi:hypothetical protein